MKNIKQKIGNCTGADDAEYTKFDKSGIWCVEHHEGDHRRYCLFKEQDNGEAMFSVQVHKDSEKTCVENLLNSKKAGEMVVGPMTFLGHVNKCCNPSGNNDITIVTKNCKSCKTCITIEIDGDFRGNQSSH